MGNHSSARTFVYTPVNPHMNHSYMTIVIDLCVFVWEHRRSDPFGPFVMRYGLVGPFKLGKECIL